jgi:hypothetical protein
MEARAVSVRAEESDKAAGAEPRSLGWKHGAELGSGKQESRKAGKQESRSVVESVPVFLLSRSIGSTEQTALRWIRVR